MSEWLETVRNTRISSLSAILELYSEIALSRKAFGIGHVYIYTFLLRMTDTMTCQNIDLSSWDIMYDNIVWRLTYCGPILIRLCGVHLFLSIYFQVFAAYT
jgi:hypothetical protein